MKLKSLTLYCSALLTSCANPIVISVNEQAIYDPSDRVRNAEVLDADLQGCINLALQQQGMDSAAQLSTLSCANAEIRDLERISFLANLRFLDLGDNNVTNITPLEDLPLLSGLNLRNNQVRDVGPLLNMPNLSSVNLHGNHSIPCSELDTLRSRFGANITLPVTCDN